MGNGFQFAPPGLYGWQTGGKNVACLSIYYNSIDFKDFSKKLMRSPPFEAKGGGKKEKSPLYLIMYIIKAPVLYSEKAGIVCRKTTQQLQWLYSKRESVFRNNSLHTMLHMV
jgi:hypothetical protein